MMRDSVEITKDGSPSRVPVNPALVLQQSNHVKCSSVMKAGMFAPDTRSRIRQTSHFYSTSGTISARS